MWAWLRRWWAGRTTSGLGARGEALAVEYLRARGCRILAVDHRNSLGELDVVALEGDTVVFVEVKTRRSTEHGEPVDAVTPDKQRRLGRAALAFLKRRGWLDRRCRFDVIAIVWADDAPRLTHYPHAFEPPGRGQLWG
jgi:putative endonuclease